LYRSDPEKGIEYGQEAKTLAERIDHQKGLAMAYNSVGLAYYTQGNYVDATINWERSLEINRSQSEDKLIANNLSNLGAIYAQFGDQVKGIDYFLQALQIAEIIRDSARMATCLINIGSVYSTFTSDLDDAIEYYLEALAICEDINYEEGIGVSRFNIGEAFYQKEIYDSALFYFEKSITSFDSNYDIVTSLNYIGKTFTEKGDFKDAIEYHKQALTLAEQDNLQLELAQILIGLANTHRKQGNLKSAIENYKRAEAISMEIGVDYELNEAYEGLAISYSQLSDFQEAFEYMVKVNTIERTIFNIEADEKINNLMHSYEIDKKENEIQILQQRSEIEQLRSKRQQIIILAIGLILLLLLILVVLVYSRLRFTRKTNTKIEAQRDEIIDQRDEIEAQRDEIEAQRDEVEAQRDQLEIQRDVVVAQKNEILDSINYAQRIQAAMLPPETLFSELLSEVFILFKPRDIVSGDFYWIKKVNQFTIVVAADCTGHGVPGAFMSMLGISFLNEIVQRREITQANQVLNEMRQQIKHSLRQHGHPDESKDGIDMAICVINEKTKQMQYSGANNSLYLIKDKNGIPELKEIKADRMPLGFYSGKDKPFTNHEFPLEIGDTFYLFSDGFIDQKGGQDNRKYLSKNFKELLFDIHDQPLYDQQKVLEKELADWIGNNSQMDDILVIGARV
jgi:serine phosphatase RsbU (regulator of sigma subunit)/Tfp pilus assembly protein PilF